MQSTLEENDKQFSRKNAFLRASAPLREKKEKNVIALRRWDAGKNLKKVVLVSEKLSCEKLQKRIRELESLETELRETEVLLKDEIKWQRLLFEESRDAIVVLDQGGNVYAANNRFAEMLGYSKEEVYHLHTWDWDVHFDKEQILDLAESVNREGHHFETQHRRKDGTIIDVELSNNGAFYRGQKLILCICRDISDRKKAEKKQAELIAQLQESLAEIKTLRGILPICSYCKKIRDDKGYWEQVEVYIHKHSGADFSHGICPECFKKYFPEEYALIEKQKKSSE